MDRVVIYGAGGFGGLVQDILQQMGTYRPVGYLDSDPAKQRTSANGLPVFGGYEQIDRLLQDGISAVTVAIGDNVTRAAVSETLVERGMRLVSAVHPLAIVSPSAELGGHVIIGARATICVHSRIGPHSVLSAGAIAEHDNVLGKAVFLDPAVRLAGGVVVEDFARVGIGASVIPGRRIGTGACVEAGAVVIENVPPHTTVGGVPATAGRKSDARFIAEAPST